MFLSWFVCYLVCLSVVRFTQNVMDEFSRHFWISFRLCGRAVCRFVSFFPFSLILLNRALPLPACMLILTRNCEIAPLTRCANVAVKLRGREWGGEKIFYPWLWVFVGDRYFNSQWRGSRVTWTRFFSNHTKILSIFWQARWRWILIS